MTYTATLTADLPLWLPGKVHAPKCHAIARKGTAVIVHTEGGTMCDVLHVSTGRQFKAVARYALDATR